MIKFAIRIALSGLTAIFASQNMTYAQGVQPGQESSVAIIDTGVLFAIGAREAEQQIRGAFGWPTFQEGFVDGVYFRFDPDGYARFSTSPRLDENVFEVTCVPGSPVCAAKKDTIEVGLTSEGQVQIRLSGITPADTFFISDKKSELPLPPSVLEPLDARLETLLASAGDLIVKRELEPVQTISLAGFSAAATYLRWVAQGQSPRVFPRGWPVPAQSELQAQAGLTTPNQWISPNQAPQNVNTTWQAQRGGTIAFNRPHQNAVNGAQSFGQATGAPFGGNGVQGGQLGAQPLTSVQLEMQALQTELAQLRAGAVQADYNGSTQWGIAPNQAAMGVQPTWGQPTRNVADDGQSFAGQAQGRTLPSPPGFPNDHYQQASGDLEQNRAPSYVGNLTGSVSTEPSSDAMSLHVLNQRIGQLEQTVLRMSRELSMQIESLKYAFAGQQARPGAATFGPDARTDFGRIEPAVPDDQRSQSRSLSELETLMMMRLNQNEQAAVPQPDQAPPANTNVSLDRSVVEELLRSMDSPASVEPRTPEPTETVAESDPGEPTSAPNGEEFISLSDYINKVLKSEGIKAAE